MSKIIDAYLEIDKALLECSRVVRPIFYSRPINAEDEKKKFISTGRDPEFIYRDLKYKPDEVESVLNSIDIPEENPILLDIFRKKRRELLLENKIVSSCGNKEKVRAASSKIYGCPTKELVHNAEVMLKKIPCAGHKKGVSKVDLKKALEKSLDYYNLNDWRIVLSKTGFTNVASAEKKVFYENNVLYKGYPERLAVHEIDVHVLRAANGYEQPFALFAIGMAGYLSTEEGLASYFEDITGNSSPEVKREYAGRVIAVDSLCNDLDFRDSFSKLKYYGFSDEKAWHITLRAYRGGGYVKDHIYLKGFFEISDFADRDGDFKTLYAGKIGLGDLVSVEKLIHQGILKSPKFLPSFLK